MVFIVTELALFFFLWRYDGEIEHAAGKIHPRQPYAGNLLDDRAGRHAVVHRHLSDEHLGRRENARAQRRRTSA